MIRDNSERNGHFNTPISKNDPIEIKTVTKQDSTLQNKNITIFGRRTSVRLEPQMWKSLEEIAKKEHCKIHDICSLIDATKEPGTSLTGAIRVFLMLYYKAAATPEGHEKAGHGHIAKMIDRIESKEQQKHLIPAAAELADKVKGVPLSAA